MPAAYYTDPETERWIYQQLRSWADDHNEIGPSVRKAAEICDIPTSTMQDIYARFKARGWITAAPFGGVFIKPVVLDASDGSRA